MAQPFRAPLEAVANTVPITALQSATIVSEISGKLERWIAAKNPATVVVPAIQDVSILQGGSVWWCKGHAVPASRAVAVLGALLTSLTENADPRRVPAGLLYVVARATDPLHLAPFSDLGDFQRTLVRYAAPRPAAAIDALVARYAVACSGLPPLGLQSTISDVRRLRRAGGVPLARIAADTMIPLSLLRELEWGVFTHWSLEHARRAIDLYAERAGLDGDAVAGVIEQESTLFLPDRVTEARAMPVPVTLPARASVRKAPMMPYALAACLLAAFLVGAPADHSSSRAPESTIAREAAAPVTVSRAPEISKPTAVGNVRRHVAPAARKRPDPRPTRFVERAPVGRRARPSDQHQHPLWKFAKAMAGDGRYKVQPFPKVEED